MYHCSVLPGMRYECTYCNCILYRMLLLYSFRHSLRRWSVRNSLLDSEPDCRGQGHANHLRGGGAGGNRTQVEAEAARDSRQVRERKAHRKILTSEVQYPVHVDDRYLYSSFVTPSSKGPKLARRPLPEEPFRDRISQWKSLLRTTHYWEYFKSISKY